MKQELGYICPQTKKQCDDECCVSAEDCHEEAINNIFSNCEPEQLNQNKMEQTAVEWLEEQIAFRNDYEKLLPIYNEDFDLSKFFNKAKKMEAKPRNHFVELSKWIIENKRSVFINADISDESKRKILNELGYSSGDY